MKKLSEQIVEWLRSWFEENGRKTAVIGISGGKDSAVVAALCVRALGPENVFGVLMPNGEQPDIADAKQVVEELGIRHAVVNIQPIFNDVMALYDSAMRDLVAVPTPSDGASINIQPRVRMTVLYTIAQTLSERDGAHACVVGTGNFSEAMVGYTTKWGDAACDVDPIGNLWVEEVIQVGDELGYYPNIIHKTPSDGLCGRSDEDNLGFTYAQVRAFFEAPDTLAEDVKEAIQKRYTASAHKRNSIPCFSRL